MYACVFSFKGCLLVRLWSPHGETLSVTRWLLLKVDTLLLPNLLILVIVGALRVCNTNIFLLIKFCCVSQRLFVLHIQVERASIVIATTPVQRVVSVFSVALVDWTCANAAKDCMEICVRTVSEGLLVDSTDFVKLTSNWYAVLYARSWN